MGAPANINLDNYVNEKYIIGVDLANAEIAEVEEMVDKEVAVKFELKEDN